MSAALTFFPRFLHARADRRADEGALRFRYRSDAVDPPPPDAKLASVHGAGIEPPGSDWDRSVVGGKDCCQPTARPHARRALRSERDRASPRLRMRHSSRARPGRVAPGAFPGAPPYPHARECFPVRPRSAGVVFKVGGAPTERSAGASGFAAPSASRPSLSTACRASISARNSLIRSCISGLVIVAMLGRQTRRRVFVSGAAVDGDCLHFSEASFKAALTVSGLFQSLTSSCSPCR